MKCRLIAVCLLAGAPFGPSRIAEAQSSTTAPDNDKPAVDPAAAVPRPKENDAQALAKQLSNPIASLISVPLQSNWDWGAGPGGDGTQYRLNIQPVLPMTLNSRWNLISRTIVPIVAQKNVVPSDHSQFGLGDVVQSLFLSPQNPTRGGLIWGAGPVLLIATGTDKLIGSEKWGAGPTIVVLKQSGSWTYGALANHIWSVAGDEHRSNVSATFMQPFAAYTTRKGTTFTLNSESTYDWTNRQWTVPLNLSVAQLFKPKTVLGLPFPIQLQGGVRYYVWKPQNGPDFGVRFNVVALFPRGK